MNLFSATLTGLAAGGAGFAALSWASVSPTNGMWGPVHFRAPSAPPEPSSHPSPGVFALTFDDGPAPESTPAVLDTLGEFGVRAAFFVIGLNAQRHPDLLARIHAEGHVVGNHTFDHDHLSMFRGRRYWDAQLRDTDDVILQSTGVRPAMFRPPMGVKTCFNMGAAARLGQAVVTWSRRGMDGVRTTPGRILGRLAPHVVGGDVVVLHDGIEPHHPGRDPSATVAAVRPLILGLRDRGLTAARLDELLRLPAYRVAPGAPPAAPSAAPVG